MKIGLHPYTCDPAANLKAALGLIRREGIAALIRCGNLTSPEMASHLAGFECY